MNRLHVLRNAWKSGSIRFYSYISLFIYLFIYSFIYRFLYLFLKFILRFQGFECIAQCPVYPSYSHISPPITPLRDVLIGVYKRVIEFSRLIVFVRIGIESGRNWPSPIAQRHSTGCQAPQSQDERQEQTLYRRYSYNGKTLRTNIVWNCKSYWKLKGINIDFTRKSGSYKNVFHINIIIKYISYFSFRKFEKKNQ